MVKEKFKIELEIKFPEVFSGLGTCTKAKAKFKMKENATPVFRPKRSRTFCDLQSNQYGIGKPREFRGHFQSRLFSMSITNCLLEEK